jgi:hypothetical protein
MLAAEVTREQLYLQLHAELPYASAVETEKYEERKDGSVAIHQQILVARDTQKAIVLGNRGAREDSEPAWPQGSPVPARGGIGEMGRGSRVVSRDRARLGGVSEAESYNANIHYMWHICAKLRSPKPSFPRKREPTVTARWKRQVPPSMGPRFRGDDDQKEGAGR